MAYNWICPNCGTHTTLQVSNFKHANTDIVVSTATKTEAVRLTHTVIKCPNTKCARFTIDVDAGFFPFQEVSHYGKAIPDGSKAIRPIGPGSFRFEPRVGRPLSSLVPVSCKGDYEEACLIKDLSPKAAATLCRRALQGMIRDFWKISKSTLAAELKAIEGQCDPALYMALMSLKAIGNIGAHPERDIDLIVDVDSGEVEELLELLKMLDLEWYVARHARAQRLASIAAIGASKDAAKSPTVEVSPALPSEP